MRVFLSIILVLSSLSAATGSEWPSADTYVNSMVDCADAAEPGWCKVSRDKWSQEYAGAISGQYQGQRNVSYCLSTGCNGAIRKNPILGCAWRFVILESGHLEIDDTDTGNLKYYCGHELVDQAGLQAAEAQAGRLLKMLGVK